MDNIEANLEQLWRELAVRMQLDQHDQVARLASLICIRLVELLDDELERRHEHQQGQDPVEGEPELGLVVALCRALRELGQLAAAYHQLAQFVRLRDWLALAKMLGAVKTGPARLAEPFELLVANLRRAIHLLAYINQREQAEQQTDSGSKSSHGSRSAFTQVKIDDELWINGRLDIKPRPSVRFGTYLMELRAGNSAEDGRSCPLIEHDICWLIKRLDELAGRDDESHSALLRTLISDQFRRFVGERLVASYPLDRFTILVAIWIVALESGHATLEQLAAELVDQIHHQESNSLDQDELLALDQLGAFWLSHHKRHSASTKARPATLLGSPPSSSASSLVASDCSLPADQQRDQKVGLSDQLKAKLRRIIDDELLVGLACPVCGQWPPAANPESDFGQLLAPLKMSYCNKCRHRPNASRCALSFRPLKLIRLESILAVSNPGSTAKPAALIVLSAGEWARACLQTNVGLLATPEGLAGQQIHVTDKFQRLTMIRQVPASISPLGDTKLIHPGLNDYDQDDAVKLLGDFMSERGKSNQNRLRERQIVTNNEAPLLHHKASESLLMIAFIAAGRKNITHMPVCRIDLLQLDSLPNDDFICICLAGTDDLASDQLWRCSKRSGLSQVMLGCGRLYTAYELVRSGQSKSSLFSCPICQLELSSCSPTVV